MVHPHYLNNENEHRNAHWKCESGDVIDEVISERTLSRLSNVKETASTVYYDAKEETMIASKI